MGAGSATISISTSIFIAASAPTAAASISSRILIFFAIVSLVFLLAYETGYGVAFRAETAPSLSYLFIALNHPRSGE